MNKFLAEIAEQPIALDKTLEYFTHGPGKEKLADAVRKWKDGGFRQILFTGMGSSYFGPHTASAILSRYGINSSILNTGELLHYHMGLLRKDTLVIAVSQSGESYEVVKLLENLPEEIETIGITNAEGSTVDRYTDISLLSQAGREDMTSTKTYVSTLMVLSILSYALAGEWNERRISGFASAIDTVENIIDTNHTWLDKVMDFFGHPHFVQVIGRGPSYSSVMQGALMFMEAARNPAAAIYGGEFRHGPMEMTRDGFRAVILAPEGSTYKQSVKIAEDITKFGGKVLMITSNNGKAENDGIFKLTVPCEDEYTFPLPAIVPLQFIVNRWATDSGNEPGDFTRGAKVTVTE